MAIRFLSGQGVTGNITVSGSVTTGTGSSVFGGSGGIPIYARSTGTVSYMQFQTSSTGSNGSNDGLTVGVNGTTAYIWNRENTSLNLGTNDTSALTLDNLQNATFAGNVTLDPSANSDVSIHMHANSGSLGDAYAWNLIAENSADNYEFTLAQGTTDVLKFNNTAAAGNNDATFTGAIAASNLSGTNTGDQTIPTDFYSVAAANAKFTSTDATGDNYTFEVEDEGNMSGNRWYHIATINNHNGGLHMRGYISNHVESFSSQKLDIAIGSREGSDGAHVEITGSLDVLHSGGGTDKSGIRIIKFEDNASYDGFKVYVRTCRYSMLTLRLTQQGSVTFNTSHSSPLTSEPAAIGGITAELDTSTTAEGNYVLDDSAIKEIFYEGHVPTYAEISGTPTLPSDFVSAANGGAFAAPISVTGGGNTLHLKKGTGNAALTFGGTSKLVVVQNSTHQLVQLEL